MSSSSQGNSISTSASSYPGISKQWISRRTPIRPEKLVSGFRVFFGSGKSHFLKVLSYLLNNRTHTNSGHSKQAVEFFESKVKDAMLFADIKRAVVANTDVILFNIDSKAGHGSSTGRDLILRVFLKVLNELQGFSGDHPHIAHMERYLESKGKLKAFHAAYEKHTGLNWLQERDAYQFNRDEVVKAFSETLGQMACIRFRRHRVRCFDGAGGGSWRDGSLPASSSLRLCA
jgi:hypothetical protein